MSVGIPARSVAAIRCGASTRFSNLMHARRLLLFVRYGSGALAHIPIAALAGVTAYMGISLLDIGTWRRLRKMHLLDAAGFLVTVIGVLVSNAVIAVIAGAGLCHSLRVQEVLTAASPYSRCGGQSCMRLQLLNRARFREGARPVDGFGHDLQPWRFARGLEGTFLLDDLLYLGDQQSLTFD